MLWEGESSKTAVDGGLVQVSIQQVTVLATVSHLMRGFRRVRIVAKDGKASHPSICPHFSAPTGRVSVKFDIGYLCENLSRDSYICLKLDNSMGQYTFLTFRGPRIVIYSYNKNQVDALISQMYFWNKTTCFGQFLCPSSGVFHCTHSNGICHTGLLTACERDQDRVPSSSRSQAVSKPVWHIPLLCVQCKTPDDG